jgi:hypothetical protein
MNDWTGSAKQRRPQGTCRPPKVSTGRVNCEWIPAGTPVMTHRYNRVKWKRHTTKIDLQILASLKRTQEFVIFKHGDWVVKVDSKYTSRKSPTSGISASN